jgi:UDP-N-acetylmuramoyl-tripeptide--D-alanyl-D-alanine ligase
MFDPDLLSIVAIAVGSIVFTVRRALRYLRYFQQEEYYPDRFTRWYLEKKAFDTRGSICAIAAFVATLGLSKFSLLWGIGGAIALAMIAFREEDPRQVGKLTLKMTERATRIYRLALVIYTIAVTLTATGFILAAPPNPPAWFWLVQILFFQVTFACIIAANGILWPGEKSRQDGFMQEAKTILGQVEPYVIGISGSYGKTSTKAILAKILECVEPTFWPPGSINTPMGITREIREKLRPEHHYAVIEMAAYKRGSVTRLCNLTPPKAGIITAVGLMHLDRFGSLENIYLSKTELPQAVPADGILVCNGDNEGARRVWTEFKKRITLVYGLELDKGHLDCWMDEIQPSESGTNFTIHWEGNAYKGFTKMLGKPMLSNILGAFTMAAALGHDPEYILAAIYNLEPEKHRLNLVRNGDGIVLDDSYNSNPTGFKAALEVLEAIPGGRKILVTPGMIELGELQDDENSKIAKEAASVCDLVAVVGDTNRKALVAGLQQGGVKTGQLLEFENRDRALSYLNQNRQPGDVVLIENDLPDLYEAAVKF